MCCCCSDGSFACTHNAIYVARNKWPTTKNTNTLKPCQSSHNAYWCIIEGSNVLRKMLQKLAGFCLSVGMRCSSGEFVCCVRWPVKPCSFYVHWCTMHICTKCAVRDITIILFGETNNYCFALYRLRISVSTETKDTWTKWTDGKYTMAVFCGYIQLMAFMFILCFSRIIKLIFWFPFFSLQKNLILDLEHTITMMDHSSQAMETLQRFLPFWDV